MRYTNQLKQHENTTMRESKENWFNTLSEALIVEGLEWAWNPHDYIGYGETFRTTVETLGRYHCIVIYRSDSGRYERPIHYDCGKA